MEKIFSIEKRYTYLVSEIEATYHEAALKCGLSDSAMRILYTICLHGEECHISEIVRLSGISKQTINSSLRKLEKDEILYLQNAEGRKKKAVLTEKGKEISQNSALKILEFENEILDEWTSEERENYVALTEKFLSSLRKKVKQLPV